MLLEHSKWASLTIQNDRTIRRNGILSIPHLQSPKCHNIVFSIKIEYCLIPLGLSDYVWVYFNTFAEFRCRFSAPVVARLTCTVL